MKIKPIHDKWGSTITFDDPLDFFESTPTHWRNLLYNRKLLIFKEMKFNVSDYIKFCYNFGRIWDETEYKYSHESVKLLNINGFLEAGNHNPFWLRLTGLTITQSSPCK